MTKHCLTVVGLLAVVVSALSTRADPPSASPVPPPPAPALTVKIKSVQIDYVKLHVKGAAAAAAASDAPTAKKAADTGDDLFDGLNQDLPKPDEAKSPQALLIVDIEVTNAGDKDAVYHTYNGTDDQCQHFASLKDDAKHFYALASFGEQEVVGAVKGPKTLKPGKTLTDRLVYEVPRSTVKALRLVLPPQNVGAGSDAKATKTVDVPLDGVKFADGK